MLKLKSRAIKQALAAAAPNTPAGMQQEITKLAQRNPSLQKWMRVSGMSVADVERMVRNGK